jgi:TolB-like protein/Tfp pilus assembly protein PilF
MAATSGPFSTDDRLDSWKEIAAYLGREVRTVQGWEKTEGLPVHRHQHARQGSVYAFKSELDAYRESRRGIPEAAIPEAAIPEVPPPKSRRGPSLIAAICVVAVVGLALLWANRRARVAGATPSSVVVLPFLDLSPQKDQEYFSDGLTEELIDALTRVPNLRVVARTSAFAFKGKAIDIRQIGEQLNVTSVLEGSVRKSGDQLRITAQLARVSDGYHLWSHTYDRSLRDIFAVQREISHSFAGQLRAGEVPHREQPSDLEAYRLYQQGRYFFNKFEPPESNLKAIERYRQAIERDPGFAQAYAGLADAYAYLAENFVSAPNEVMPKAREAAEKAVTLDDSSAEAHTSLGIVKLDYDRDRDGAQREFVRAMQLNPGSGYAHHWYAHSLEAQGRLDAAMKEMRAALDLDPLSLPINWDIGSELEGAGRYDEALQHLQKAAELFPNNPVLAFLQLEAYYKKGDRESARRVVESQRASQPEMAKDPMFLSMTGIQAALDGRRGETRRILAQFERLRQTQYVDPFMAILLCSALNDKGQLLLWLKRADEERSTMFVYLPFMKDLYGLDAATVAQLASAR